uniref:Phosphatase and actin regulator n=2 Tax=Denticeps clupeoides TaxID=299321 RepID=A0AAY4EIM2_9TELE
MQSSDTAEQRADVMDQQRALHSGCLVTGVRTPPVRRNSKLASLGRIFKPWKWRKKKNEKLKQGSTAAQERKTAARQNRDELTRKGLGVTGPVGLLFFLLCVAGSQSNHVRPSPATLPRNFTLPKDSFRGKISTPTGSPHLGGMHPQLPPSCIIEELHRALATKHRQDSFNGKEVRSSPKRRSDGRLSRTSSTEKEPCVEVENKKEAEENKENMRLDEYYNDPDSWNESVISGTLPRRIRKELLAIKLGNRPSKQELEERNIFPVRSDQERQEIRQQIEMKLAKRLSQRPAVEELESRNILKQRNDQTEQEERREIKQRLNRKLNQRPTVDELRDRKILIRFSDYVEVAKAQDYDRRADKPWTRLSAADKAAIRKELNEFKSNEMEVHASSKHLTRFHRP